MSGESTHPLFEVTDRNGRRVRVGDRVTDGGTVVEVTEPDADYDDNLGRAVQYGPCVVVRFDPFGEYPDGVDDRFLASYVYQGDWCDRPSYVCDDVEVEGPS